MSANHVAGIRARRGSCWRGVSMPLFATLMFCAALVVVAVPLAAQQQDSEWEVFSTDGIISATIGRESIPPLQVVDVGPPQPVDIPSRVVGSVPGRRISVEQVVTEGVGGDFVDTGFGGGINCMAEGTDGSIWVGTSWGLWRYGGREWVRFRTSDGLHSNLVVALAVAPNGDVWAAGHKGLTQFTGTRWIQHHLLVPGDFDLETVAVGPDGHVWTGSSRETDSYDGEAGRLIQQAALFQYDGTDWWEYGEEQGLSSRAHVRFVAVDKQGTVWISQVRAADGLLSLSGATLTAYTILAPSVLCPDKEYGIWARLFHSTPSGWVRAGGAHLRSVSLLTQDALGRLWVHTGNGWGVLDGTQWYYHTLDDVWVYGMAVLWDSHGSIWMEAGRETYHLVRWRPSLLPTGIEATPESGQPSGLRLLPNYPNPFNRSTMVGWTMPHHQRVSLQILNSSGQVVNTLLDGRVGAGTHAQAWDGTDKANHPLGSGTYFCRLVADGTTAVRALTLIK